MPLAYDRDVKTSNVRTVITHISNPLKVGTWEVPAVLWLQLQLGRGLRPRACYMAQLGMVALG